ncbi:hypothetical protein RIF29_28379 [Crotalaria pallida]|uniref:Uncharacterized protein n=1 Tax=Crotalaria pallida TaxID=3830 RepID=A0AAN9HWG8_CROPI
MYVHPARTTFSIVTNISHVPLILEKLLPCVLSPSPFSQTNVNPHRRFFFSDSISRFRIRLFSFFRVSSD